MMGMLTPLAAPTRWQLQHEIWAPRSYRGNRVTDIKQLPSGEFEVVTDRGNVKCEHVVNAAGCYADRVSSWLGVDTQFTNMLHQYVVTDHIPEFIEMGQDWEMPVMRDPYASSYYRQEQMAGLIGIYERYGTEEAWPGVGQKWEAENELFPEDFDKIMPWLERVMERMPIFANAGIMRVVHGAISHTIDSNPLVGPAPGVQNFWLVHRLQHRHCSRRWLRQISGPVDGAWGRRDQHDWPGSTPLWRLCRQSLH